MEDNFALKLAQMRDDHTRKVKADEQKFKELLQGKEDFAMLKTQEMEEAENQHTAHLDNIKYEFLQVKR